MASLYQLHVDKWTGCTKCVLHLCRNRMVFGRGTVPCDILFIGEAPGASENSLGYPFAGPAGEFLDILISQSEIDKYRLGFTNLVSCIPLGDDRKKLAAPDDEDIKACAPRLQEFYRIAKPKMVITLGGLAEKWLDRVLPEHTGLTAAAIHPAAILRAMQAQRGYLRQKLLISLQDAKEQYEDAITGKTT